MTLHDEDGYVDFGPAGGSYYYSRPKMTATGTLTLDGETFPVTGTAWFDHQWGDFISVGGGGWDWFAVNLDDGTDLTLSLVRAADGSYPLIYGTLTRPDGSTEHLPREAFTVEVTADVDVAGDRRDVPGRLAHHRARRRTLVMELRAHRRGAGAGHARDDRRRLLGGVAGRDRDARRACRWAARRTWSSPATAPGCWRRRRRHARVRAMDDEALEDAGADDAGDPWDRRPGTWTPHPSVACSCPAAPPPAEGVDWAEYPLRAGALLDRPGGRCGGHRPDRCAPSTGCWTRS